MGIYHHKKAQELSVEKINTFREVFQSAAQKMWISPPYYDIVRRRASDIGQGKRPGSDLVILDDEFSPASRQLYEFAMIEGISGKILINTCIAHENGLDHGSMGGDSFFLRNMSQNKAATVFSSNRPADTERLKANEIALRLQEAGINQDTIILVWSLGKYDLTLLRNFLESAGYSGILPPDENCIPMVQLFRKNLPVGPPGYSSFPLKLEILFPILYPRHSLIGFNHHALQDTQQTRLVWMAFDELCKPKWQPDTVTNTAQKTLLNWVQGEPLADKAKGENDPFEEH